MVRYLKRDHDNLYQYNWRLRFGALEPVNPIRENLPRLRRPGQNPQQYTVKNSGLVIAVVAAYQPGPDVAPKLVAVRESNIRLLLLDPG